MPLRAENFKNPFEEIQNSQNIADVAGKIGLRVKRVGRQYRANSLAGGGTFALTLYPETNTWHDFKLDEGGDITDLVARVMFNGDKSEALEYLLPNWKAKRGSTYGGHFSNNWEAYQVKANRFKNDYAEGVENFKNERYHWHEYLRWRGLKDEYIENMGFALLKTSGGSGERLCVPFWNINKKEVVYFITRRVTEPIKDENGNITSFRDTGYLYNTSASKKEKEENPFARIDFLYNSDKESVPKYMKPLGETYPTLNNTPWGLHTIHRENDELFIAEGMFDAMLLDQDGASVLSPASGYFGKNWDKVIGIAKKFKYVILAFDNDEAGKKFTYEAAKKLLKERIPFKCANFYGKDIADFYQVAGGNLQKLINSAVKGMDWIANRIVEGKKLEEMTSEERSKAKENFKEIMYNLGTVCDQSDIEDIVDKVKYFFDKSWLRAVKKEALQCGNEQYWARKIIGERHVAYDERIGLIMYFDRNAHWEKITDTTLGQIVLETIGERCTVSKMKKVVQAIKNLSNDPKIPFNLDRLPLLVFSNCTIHINQTTGEIEQQEHDMSDYNTVALHYNYNPEARSSIFLPALNEIFNGNQDSIKTLQEWFGYTLFSDNRFQKALIAIGTGSNGKSFVTEIMRAMLGGQSEDGRSLVSTVQTSKINDNFRAINLRGSWLNISAECDVKVDSSALLKSIIAGEHIEDSHKGKDVISFRPRAKLWTNCNEFPMFNDKSYGMMRRFIFLEFPVRFCDNPNEKFGEKQVVYDLVDKIIHDDLELAAIFNWACEGFKRLVQNKGFTKTSDMEKLEARFLRHNNELANFIDENKEKLKDEGVVDRRVIYKMYRAYATENNEELLSARRFYNLFWNTCDIMRIKIRAIDKGYYKEWDFSQMDL